MRDARRNQNHITGMRRKGTAVDIHQDFSAQEKIKLIIIMTVSRYAFDIFIAVIKNFKVLRDHILPRTENSL